MKNVQPKVTLISVAGYEDACVAARNCVSSDNIQTILDNTKFNYEANDKLLHSVIIGNGHESIAEFIKFTFAIEGVNLATLGQYSRHRLQSLTVKSQRYITHKELVTSLPFYISEDQRIHDLFNRSYELYNDLIGVGVAPEDARLVLPQAVSTTIVCSMNARELIHIVEERDCTCTQEQHRNVANQMLGIARNSFACIFDHVGPKCYRLGRCPEKRNSKGCQLFKKSPYWKE